MGYGCWNASGLDREENPKTLTFDYAYTSSDEFKDLQASGEVNEDESFEEFSQIEFRDEFENWSSTICGAGHYLAKQGLSVQTYSPRDEPYRRPWAFHGDRYQYLKPAFEVGKVGVWWQEEPFMGSALCVVVAPLYHFEENHDVWDLTDEEFRRAYRMSIDRFKDSAMRQTALLTDFVLAYMEDQMSAVSNQAASVGSGYIRSYFKPEEVKSLSTATKALVRSVQTAKQRQQLKVVAIAAQQFEARI